VKSLVKAVH